MTMIRRLILAFALIAGIAPAIAQVPPPVPALPDAERRTSYNLSASTCACSVGFALYGDSTDFNNWVEVFLNGVKVNFNDATFGWTITVPTQTLATRARPITDAVLTFTGAQTGAVQIVGARRPRRTTQFNEGAGVPTRNFNVVLSDLTAQNRELWDKTNDVTGRAVQARPGETMALLPPLASRQNFGACFDNGGNLTTCISVPTGTFSAGNGILFTGTNPTTINLKNSVTAGDYGVLCNGLADDAPALQLAVNAADALGGLTTIMPAGRCIIGSTVFLNKFTTTSLLTVPGLKIRGQGKDVTTIDGRVPGGYALAVNPDWKAAHKSLFGISAATGGSGALATNTYYVQITMNDNLGNEIFVTQPRSIAVTGPTGRIAITLNPLNSGYSYNLYCSASPTTQPANYCIVGGGNAIAIGGNQTVNIDAVGSVHAVPTASIATWQNAEFADMSIISTGTGAASGILCFKCGYSNFTNLYFNNLTGSGLDIPNYTGDSDGGFVITVDKSKFDHVAGWGINAAGNTLELSSFTVSNSIFNLTGTATPGLNVGKSISSITNAVTPVITASAHGLLANDQIAFTVSGMTLASTWYRACGTVTANTFNLCDQNGLTVDTTSLGSFSSGQVTLQWRPPTVSGGIVNGSGGIAWTGLIGTFKNNSFTQVNGTAMYFSEAGASDNATIENTDFENTAGKGLYVAALAGGSLNNSECLAATALGKTLSCVQLGTGFAAGGVYNFKINNMKVRTDVSPAVGFEQFGNTNLTPGSYPDQVRVSNIAWQTFDAAGQTRFNGFTFDPIPGQVKFSVSATNTFKLIPTGFGSTLPLHLKANGEWIAYAVPDAGITAAVTTSSPNTTYNIYATNSATTSFPYVIAFLADTVAPVLNKGYSVRASDTTQVLIGTATTDGSGNFQPGNAQTSQFPPPAASVATSSLTGTLQAAQEPAHTGDCTNSAGSLALTCLNTNGAPFTGPATAAYAAKTNMQTPSSSALVVNPRDVQDHPGVAKFAGRLDGKTGATCAVTSGYNIASCSRSAVGTYNVVFTTAFATTTYSLSGSAHNTGVSTGVIAPTGAYATGNVSFSCINLGTNAAMDCDIMNIQGFGAQ